MEVHLPNGYTTLVDEEIWLRKSLFLLPWYGARMSMDRVYVIAKVRDPVTGRQRPLRLHRVVMDARPGRDVDHVSGSGLDNRAENLRLCDDPRNQQNTDGREARLASRGCPG